jgi:hypothetical protein
MSTTDDDAIHVQLMEPLYLGKVTWTKERQQTDELQYAGGSNADHTDSHYYNK